MNGIRILIGLGLLAAFNACEKVTDNEKYNPRLTVKALSPDRNYYDFAEPLDTLRIGSKLIFIFSAQANGYTNAYIESLQIIDPVTGAIIKDTTVNNAGVSFSEQYLTPLHEATVSREIRITDNIGNTNDTTFTFVFSNKGILGEWYFHRSNVKGSFRYEGLIGIFLEGLVDGSYDFKIYTNDSVRHINGFYSQAKSDGHWEIEMNQVRPDTATFKGLFELSGSLKDTMRMYFVQTQPDIGLVPPDEMVVKDSFAMGEYFLTGQLVK